MRSRARGLFGLLVGLAFSTFAACGTDSAGPDPVDLAEGLDAAEAALVMSMLLSIYTPSPSSPSLVPAAGPTLAPMVSIRADTTQNAIACPANGSVSVLYADSIRIVSDTRVNPHVDTAYVATATWGGVSDSETRYQSCATRDSRGNVWTFDATPGLTFDMDMVGDLEIVSLTSGSVVSRSTLGWEADWSGSFNWSNGSRSGQCAVSVQMTSSAVVVGSQATSSYQYVGQVCGLAVSVTS